MYRYFGAPAMATPELEHNNVICEVCNVRCNDIGTLRYHEEGKKHRMNLDLQAESCMMSNVDENIPKVVQSGATLDYHRHHEAENCMMSNVDNNIPKVVQTVTCEVCQIQCGTTLDDLRRHETGTDHKRILWKLQAENRLMSNLDKNIPEVVQSVTCEVCQIECGTTLDDLKRHETGRNHKRILWKLQQVVHCEVCWIQCGTTLDDLRRHETSAKHKRILLKLQAKNRPMSNLVKETPAQPATCVVCKIQCPLASLRVHETGKKHKKNLKKLQALEAGAAQGDLKTTCEVCKRQCHNLDNLRTHETSKKHKKNLEKLQGSITPEPAKPPNDVVGASTEPAAAAVADGVIPAVPLKMNKRPINCEVCKICCGFTLNCLRIHETGKQHKKNLEKLQGSITPEPAKHANDAVGASTEPAAAAVADGVIPAVPLKMNKRPINCEVCKICCGFTLNCLRAHETGKKHKKNLDKLQGSITPEPAKHANDAVGASTEPAAAAVADGVMPAVPLKMNKRPAASLEDLEVKRRRVIEAGSAEGEVKNCTMSNAVKKIPEDVQPVTCEVCKMQCNGGLRAHKRGKQHKKNLKKSQDSITPKQENPLNGAVGASTTPVAAAADVANGVIPAVQPTKKKRPASTQEDLEVKRRRVLENGAAEGEVEICTMCNVVSNSQKKHETHIAGSRHQANLQLQQLQQQQQVQQLPIVA